MALLDDTAWVLAYIRNQFIVSDDTSVCETVIGPDLEYDCDADRPFTGLLGRRSPDDSNQRGSWIRALSPDIVLESENRATRRRSNTAVRLEKIRRDRDEKGRVTTTRWKSSKPNGTGPPSRNGRLTSQSSTGSLNADLDIAFEQLVLQPRPRVTQSLLSLNLDTIVDTERRPQYIEYARFDGQLLKNHTKTFMVYFHLPDIPPGKVNALNISVVDNARFSDLVGLACLRWTLVNGTPCLEKPAANYAMRYAEPTGEIDEDFPGIAIDSLEPVGKFGTNTLAFVENQEAVSLGSSDQIIVTVHLVEGSFSKFVFDSTDVPLSAILDKVLKKRKMNASVRGLEYTLEKKGSPGIPLDLTHPLSSHGFTRDFWMIRMNSKNPSLSSTSFVTVSDSM